MKKTNNRERGQSLVELALSFTILLLLMGGAIDLGRAFFTFITLRDAAREGAIYGSYAPDPACDNKIRARVRGSATSPIDAVGLTSIDITRAPGTNPGDGITVAVHYNFETTMPLMGGKTFPITATVSDTILRNDASCP